MVHILPPKRNDVTFYFPNEVEQTEDTAPSLLAKATDGTEGSTRKTDH